MATRFENQEAQATTAASMTGITTVWLRQLLSEVAKLAPIADQVCQTPQMTGLTTALVAAIRRAISTHKSVDGMAFAIANECMAEVKAQVELAVSAAAEGSGVVLGENAVQRLVEALEAFVEDLFMDEALDLVAEN